MEYLIGKTESATLALWLKKYPTPEQQESPSVTIGERLLVCGSLVRACRQHKNGTITEKELVKAAELLSGIPWRVNLSITIRAFLDGGYPDVWPLTFFNLALQIGRVDLVEAGILGRRNKDPRFLWNFICGLGFTRKDHEPIDKSPFAPLVLMAFALLPMDSETRDYVTQDRALFPLLFECAKLTKPHHKVYKCTRRRNPVFNLLKQRYKTRTAFSLEEVAYLANHRDTEAIEEIAEDVAFYWGIFAQPDQLSWVVELMGINDPHRDLLCEILRKRRKLDAVPGDIEAAIQILQISESTCGDHEFSYLYCMLEAHLEPGEPFTKEALEHFSRIPCYRRKDLMTDLGLLIHSFPRVTRPLTLLWLAH